MTAKHEEKPAVSKLPVTPQELRRLPVDSLPEVASGLRSRIIDTLSTKPGHFASSMGAVDLTVALHYVFDTPRDRIVWDVGHQAYAHKLLTNRADRFDTLREMNGLSGFPNPSESEFDTFIAGHAGNSISAALGMAVADMNTPGQENRRTVAVIGDASISGGLAFEGLNNVSNNPNNLLIILNDNDMSIDNNVGALHRYLTELNTSPGYNRWRLKTYNAFKNLGLVKESGRGRLLRFNNSLKSFIADHQNIFEGLNIRYFGPIDGHDIPRLVRTLNEIKDMKGPRLLHIRTVKGKGFEAAEKNPSVWHAPGKFDPLTGERQKKTDSPQPLPWQEIFGRTLVELADADERVMGITAAMPSGTSMSHLLKKYPKRAFDVGISEGHAVTFAGGLAAAGKRPFVAIYSSFLQRAYDNIIHDVAIQGLPVTFAIDRAGIVGEDGVTHHGLFDLSYLNCIPGLKIAAPADEKTLRNIMHSSLSWEGPLAVRYPRGKSVNIEWNTPFESITLGKGALAFGSGDAKTVVIAIGPVVHDAVEVAKKLVSEGINVDVYDMIWLKPLDAEIIKKVAHTAAHVITVEDGTVTGGLGSTVRTALQDAGWKGDMKVLGVPDKWIHQGTVDQLHHLCGFDREGIEKAIRSFNSDK